MSTPSLYIDPDMLKAGKLYSQLPPDGSGDFTVVRNTIANRTNASGLISSVAANVPRLDYPIGGGCPSLLVEPAATNGILNSQDSSTNWLTGANLTSSLSVIQGINGRELQVAIAGSNIGVAAGRYRIGSLSFNLVSGSTYTISFIVKRTSTHSIFGYYALATNDLGGGFDVSNLTTGAFFSNADFGSRVRRITPLGNDEFLCEETFTMTASRTLTAFHVAPVAGVTNSANASLNSRIAFAAPQIELGAVATSRILTGNTIQTRNADVISLTGASALIGQTQGTLYAEFTNTLVSSYTQSILIRVFADANNELFIRKEGAGTTYTARWRANSVNTTFTNIPVLNGVNKISFAYQSGSTVVFLNGVQIGATNTDVRSFSVAPSTIALGSSSVGEFFNDRIRTVALYKTRLPNAELQALTTL